MCTTFNVSFSSKTPSLSSSGSSSSLIPSLSSSGSSSSEIPSLSSSSSLMSRIPSLSKSRSPTWCFGCQISPLIFGSRKSATFYVALLVLLSMCFSKYGETKISIWSAGFHYYLLKSSLEGWILNQMTMSWWKWSWNIK